MGVAGLLAVQGCEVSGAWFLQGCVLEHEGPRGGAAGSSGQWESLQWGHEEQGGASPRTFPL